MSKNEQIVRTFLEQMLGQDNRATALPIFYVIRSEVEKQADPRNCDVVKFYQPDWDQSYNSKEEFEKDMDKEGIDDDKEREYLLNQLAEYGIRKEWEEHGMFLTEQDAEGYLKSNHYHYSNNAHTYVKHAWRAPYLKEFFEALFAHFGYEYKLPPIKPVGEKNE